MTRRYIYSHAPAESPWKGATCTAVLDARRKCIRGRKGNMLVRMEPCGTLVTVQARDLRRKDRP